MLHVEDGFVVVISVAKSGAGGGPVGGGVVRLGPGISGAGGMGSGEEGPEGFFRDEGLGDLGGGTFFPGGFLRGVGFGLPWFCDDGLLDAAGFMDGEAVPDFAVEIEHFDVDGVFVDGDEAGAIFDDDSFHDGAGAPAADAGATVTGDDGDGAIVRTEAGAFTVGAVAGGVAVAIVKDDSFGGGGGVVGAIDEHGAFVDVGVAAEYHIDSAAFEDGHDVFAHLGGAGLDVGVMGAFGVWRVVEEGDDEVGLGLFEVGLEPLGHFAAGGAVEVMGV